MKKISEEDKTIKVLEGDKSDDLQPFAADNKSDEACLFVHPGALLPESAHWDPCNNISVGTAEIALPAPAVHHAENNPVPTVYINPLLLRRTIEIN